MQVDKSNYSLKAVFNAESVNRSVDILRAITNKPKGDIIKLLLKKEKGWTVTELYTKLNMTQSLCSQHLAGLRKVGIVKCRTQGQSRLYSINYPVLHEIQGWIGDSPSPEEKKPKSKVAIQKAGKGVLHKGMLHLSPIEEDIIH